MSMSAFKETRYVAVDAEALRTLLRALNGPEHYIRELQATRDIDRLPGQERNPINVLHEQFEIQMKHPVRAHVELETSRGSKRVLFKDFYGRDSSLQESRVSGTHAVWLGIDSEQLKRDMAAHPNSDPRSRMQLTEEDVSNLLPYLLRFLAQGEL
jgi:hypothetical protein